MARLALLVLLTLWGHRAVQAQCSDALEDRWNELFNHLGQLHQSQDSALQQLTGEQEQTRQSGQNNGWSELQTYEENLYNSVEGLHSAHYNAWLNLLQAQQIEIDDETNYGEGETDALLKEHEQIKIDLQNTQYLELMRHGFHDQRGKSAKRTSINKNQSNLKTRQHKTKQLLLNNQSKTQKNLKTKGKQQTDRLRQNFIKGLQGVPADLTRTYNCHSSEKDHLDLIQSLERSHLLNRKGFTLSALQINQQKELTELQQHNNAVKQTASERRASEKNHYHSDQTQLLKLIEALHSKEDQQLDNYLRNTEEQLENEHRKNEQMMEDMWEEMEQQLNNEQSQYRQQLENTHKAQVEYVLHLIEQHENVA